MEAVDRFDRLIGGKANLTEAQRLVFLTASGDWRRHSVAAILWAAEGADTRDEFERLLEVYKRNHPGDLRSEPIFWADNGDGWSSLETGMAYKDYRRELRKAYHIIKAAARKEGHLMDPIERAATPAPELDLESCPTCSVWGTPGNGHCPDCNHCWGCGGGAEVWSERDAWRAGRLQNIFADIDDEELQELEAVAVVPGTADGGEAAYSVPLDQMRRRAQAFAPVLIELFARVRFSSLDDLDDWNDWDRHRFFRLLVAEVAAVQLELIEAEGLEALFIAPAEVER